MPDAIVAEASPAPDPNAIVMPDNPITDPEPKKPEPKVEEKPKPSLRDSIAKAKAKVDAAEVDPKAVKTEAKPKVEVKTEKVDPKAKPETKTEPVKSERPRGEHGHFAPDPNKTDAENEAARRESEVKDAATTRQSEAKPGDTTDHRQPPARFSQAAKETWATLPEETQKETHRAFRELEAGLTKHREGSARYNEVFKTYDDMAKQSNVDPKATLEGYIAIDRALHSGNPQHIVGAINEVMKAAGIDPKQYAQAILGGQQQQPNQQQERQAQPSAEVVELRRTVAQLQEKLGGVEQHIQSQVKDRHQQTLQEWGADKPHWDKLLPQIRTLVKDEGLSPDDAYASALVAAQDQARAFLGDSALKTPSPRPSKSSTEELSEQIEKGSRSINGAPSAGAEPASRKSGPLPPLKESIARAMRSVV